MNKVWRVRPRVVVVLLALFTLMLPFPAAAQKGNPGGGPKNVPDLVLLEAAVPHNALPGEAFAIGYTVQNAGTKAANSITLHALLGTEVIGQATISKLAAGESSNGAFGVIIPSSTPPGHYALTVAVDPANNVKESNEANNSLTGTISIDPSPTVTPTLTATLSWDPNSEPTLAGYKLHVGTVPGTYDTVLDVGNLTTFVLSGLQQGMTYFFAVSAYDAEGNQSPLSVEVHKSFSS